MKKIYLILMQTNTIPARFIRLFTRYKYSHVALSFSDDCNLVYSFGRKKVNNFIDAGFVIESKNGPFFKKFNNTTCTIYEVDITEDQYEKAVKIMEFMKHNDFKYGYDFLGAFLRYFRIPISFKNRYVCSYFVAEVLEKSDIYKFNKPTYCILPKDFSEIGDFKVVYEGKFVNNF